MRSDRTRGEVVRASLLGLLGIVAFGGILVALEVGFLLAEGLSGPDLAREISVFSRNAAPWAFLVGGVVAGLSLRSLLLDPLVRTSALTNAYFFVLSLLFHGFVGGVTVGLLFVQVQTFFLGLVLVGIAAALGSLVELEKERRGLRE